MGAPAPTPTTLVIDAHKLDADGATLDALARLALIARRHGCELLLRDASDELRDLVEFAGLSAVLPTSAIPGSTEPRC